MRRFFLLLAGSLACVLLASCGSATPTARPVVVTSTVVHQPSGTPAKPQVRIGDCQEIVAHSTPVVTQTSLFPAVKSSDHVQGPANATVTVIEYCDYQSRGCGVLAGMLKQLRQKFPNGLRLVYRALPLDAINDKDSLAARAAEAAARQGKFWEMNDLLYSDQQTWSTQKPQVFQTWVADQAATKLGLNRSQFVTDFSSTGTISRVQSAVDFSQQSGVTVVPIVLINGTIQPLPFTYQDLETIVQVILLSKRQFTTCPPVVIDPSRQYFATLKTDQGDIVLELYADKAPNTVNNFVFLAQQGWFDNIPFYRVIPGYMAQTGDPSGTGLGNPGYFIDDEIDSTLTYDRAGLVGMLSAGPNFNGSQFFITYAPEPSLNGEYTLFGEVLSGMDVLRKLSPRDPKPGVTLPDGSTLISVKIEAK